MATTGGANGRHGAEERDDPVVIGGIGGSGTRVVAKVLQTCGLQLPGPTTPQLDSSWSTILFRRPRWRTVLTGPESARPDAELVATFELLRTMMVGGELDRQRLERLAAAAADVAALGVEPEVPGVRWWAPHKPFQFVAEYVTQRPQLKPGPFGWKHPIVYLLLPELLQVFPRARYIHVLRDPLDMAWSGNLQGVRLWGPVAGIDPAEIEARPQNAQLAWWLYSTQLALRAGRAMGDRFTVVRLEQLAEHPRAVTRRLAAFAGLEPDSSALSSAIDAVERPESIGRSAEHPLDVFDPKLLAEAQAYVKRWAAPSGAGEASDPEPASDTAS
jgi:hypothetical protein